jgi:hypothetical protein
VPESEELESIKKEMSNSRTDRYLLIVALIGSATMVFASLSIPLYIFYEYGFSVGNGYDRSGHVIGSIRYIYGGLVMAFLGVTFCGWSFTRTLKKLKSLKLAKARASTSSPSQ